MYFTEGHTDLPQEAIGLESNCFLRGVHTRNLLPHDFPEGGGGGGGGQSGSAHERMILTVSQMCMHS